jgi:putative sugar O-methyltransferase
LRETFDGSRKAREDYRLFRAADPASGMNLDVSESEVGGGERFEFDGSRYSRSFLNYLRALTYLKKLADTEALSSILEIGGGYGTLGEILLKSRPHGLYVNVDIPPVAAVSSWYLKQVFGEDAVLGFAQSRQMKTLDLDALRNSFRAVVVCPWQLPALRGNVDLFANFMSFQEMEPEVVANYAALVQPLTRSYVLLRNSVEGKKVAARPGEVGVLKPTTTDATIGAFDQFRLLGRDSAVFGDENRRSGFRSQVLCMQRHTV